MTPSKNMKWITASVLVVAFFVGPPTLYHFRHAIWGKSLFFYLSTGLRMPQSAKIVNVRESYPMATSNEGETLVVFDVTGDDVKNFLAKGTWWDRPWSKGPVSDNIQSNCGSGSGVWDSSKIWYTAKSTSGAADFWDGELLVIDPARNRVYWLDWNH